jgi:hypothetical protein
MTVAILPTSFAWRSVDFVPPEDFREIEVFLIYIKHLMRSNPTQGFVVANDDGNQTTNRPQQRSVAICCRKRQLRWCLLRGLGTKTCMTSGGGQRQDLLGSGPHTSECGAPGFPRVRCRMGRGGWVYFTEDRTRCPVSANCGLLGSDSWSDRGGFNLQCIEIVLERCRAFLGHRAFGPCCAFG